MLIYCKLNNELQTIKIHKFSSLLHLKNLIKKKIKLKDYILEYEGKILNHLDDTAYLDKLHIKNNSTINIIQKVKGGVNALTVMLIILCVILIFIIIPLLLISGFLPFIAQIAQLFIFKIINCFLSKVFRLPRIAEHRKVISFFVKCFMLFFSLFFMYYAVNLVFTIVFFLWVAVLKGGDGLFTLSSSYCTSISTLKIISEVLSIVFIIFYGGLKAPNLLFKTMGSFISFTEKANISLIFQWMNPLYASLKEFVYEGKYTPFEAIPVFGQLMMGYFEALDTGVNLITEYLADIIQLGCSGNPIDISSLINKLKSTASSMSSSKQKKSSKKTNNSSTPQLNYNKTYEGNSTTNTSIPTATLVSAVKKRTTKQNLQFWKKKQSGGDQNDEYKCELINLNVDCCSDEMFQSLSSQFKSMYNNKEIANILKETGFYKIMDLIIYAFNVNQVKQDMSKFNNAFGPFKLLDTNIKAVAATLMRYATCNIFYLADFFQNTIFQLGTPEDISDTIRCGFIGGIITAVIYIICLIVVIFIVLLG